MLTPRFDRAAGLRVVLLGCLLLNGGLAFGQSSTQSSAQSPVLYGTSAGAAMAEVRGPLLSLANQMMEAQWSVRARKLTGLKFMVREFSRCKRIPGLREQLNIFRARLFWCGCKTRQKQFL